MLRSNVRTLALAAACTFAAATPALAQGAFAKALPQDTILYVSFPDLQTSMREMQGVALAKMWHESEVQDFFADALKMVHQEWDNGMAQAREAHAQGQLPFDPDELVKMRVNGASFAVTQMSMTMPEGAHEPLPRFGMVAHLDFGDSAPIWRKVIETGLQMAQAEAGDELAMSSLDAGGAKIMTLRPTEAPEGFEMGLNLAFVGNGLVFGTLQSDVVGLINGLASGNGGLVQSAGFKQVGAKVGAQGAEMEFYFRPTAMFDFMMNTLRLAEDQGELPPELSIDGVDRAITALGLRAMQGIASSSSYVDGRAVTNSFVAMPKAARVGLFADTTGTLDAKFLRWVPKDAVSFSASRFDFSKVYTALTGALQAYDKDMAEMVMGQLGQMEEQLGMSLEKDFFGAFGDEMISWQMPMAGFGSAPEMAVLVKVNDQERLLNTLNTLAAMTQGKLAIDKVDRRGITVYQVRLELDLGSEMGGMNPLAAFQPTFGFKDGYLVLAFSTGDVKRAFTRMEREDDPTGDIRSNAEFAPYLAKLPKDVDSVSFTDWKATFEGYYQLVTSLLAFVPLDEEIPFDLTLLPESQTLTQHLFGGVSWSRTTDEGMVSTTISPFGPETVALMAGAIGAGLGVAATVANAQGMGPIRIR